MKRTFFALLLVFGLTSCTKQTPPPERTKIDVPPAMVPEHQVEPEIVEPEQWDEKTFQGEWNTTRRLELDGIMYCQIHRTGDVFAARFWGTYAGSEFEYNVKFDGPLENLKGRPVRIQGNSYEWSGRIKDGVFDGEFTSSRYNGSFSLKEKAFTVPLPTK